MEIIMYSIKIILIILLSFSTIIICEKNSYSISTNENLPKDQTTPSSIQNIQDDKKINIVEKDPFVSDAPLISNVVTTTPLNIMYTSNEKSESAVERQLVIFKDKIKKTFSIYLERSAKYIEIMKNILIEKNLPEDLVFLPMIESGFNPQAYSRAKAVGPWQFIESTGKRYGLTIDWWRDERKDPIRSTIAAAEYLIDLYRMFGSWNLALAAYNAGEGRISRAMVKTSSDNYWQLLETKHIKRETKEYVPKYIAATLIATNPDNYGFLDLDYHKPFEYDEVTLYKPIDIDIIAICAKTSAKEIRELNPELKRWATPPDLSEYTIRIPFGSKQVFLDNLSLVPENKRFSYSTYKVKTNRETLKIISKKLHFPLFTLISLNNIDGDKVFSIGDVIKIPPKGKFFANISDKISNKKIKKKSVYKKSSLTKKVSLTKKNKIRAKGI